MVAHAVHPFGGLGRLSTHMLRHLWDHVQIKAAHLLKAEATVWIFSGATLPEAPCHHGGRSWSGPDPKGGGDPPPPLRTPKLSHGTRCFVGARGAGDFVLGIRQGEFFLFHPMCLYSKYSEFCGEFKNG